MSFAEVYSAHATCLESQIITIQADISPGLFSFSLVGMGNKAVDEARDRVASALRNSGFVSPKQRNHRVVISLAPAHIRKEGSIYDLGIALAYLKASGELDFDHRHMLFVGELSLDGVLKPIQGALSIAMYARSQGFQYICLPIENALEAAFVADIRVIPARSINEVVEHIRGYQIIEPVPHTVPTASTYHHHNFDMIRGNELAKKALCIAAMGGHNIALYGPPGTGKTLLAKAYHELIPPLDFPKFLEVYALYSATGVPMHMDMRPPFRSPHHTASHIALVGGGSHPRPGEITLAHRGVLFLDEFPEFDRSVIESLRQPLEEKKITISRARGSMTFPADFQLVITMNPCPCGYAGMVRCACTAKMIADYGRKISGPIADRIDIWIEVAKIDYESLTSIQNPPDVLEKENILDKIASVRDIGYRKRGCLNAHIHHAALPSLPIDHDASHEFRRAAERLGLSIRGYHRTLRVAQTLCDMRDGESITLADILEALQMRRVV